MNSGSHEGWRAAPAGLRRGTLMISFQRILERDEPVGRAPSSLGALPIAASSAAFVLPLADAEAFWIGIEGAGPAGAAVTIHARFTDGRERSIARHEAPTFAVVAGLTCPDGRHRVFARSWLERICIRSGDEMAEVLPVTPQTFTSISGREAPPPLAEVSGYRGRRLP